MPKQEASSSPRFAGVTGGAATRSVASVSGGLLAAPDHCTVAWFLICSRQARQRTVCTGRTGCFLPRPLPEAAATMVAFASRGLSSLCWAVPGLLGTSVHPGRQLGRTAQAPFVCRLAAGRCGELCAHAAQVTKHVCHEQLLAEVVLVARAFRRFRDSIRPPPGSRRRVPCK
jgi:hypothetical protein